MDSEKCPRCGEPAAESLSRTATLPAGNPTGLRRRDSLSRLSSSTADEGRFLPGTLVAGRYRVIGLVGRGGMGEVYRATDLTLGQSVALKFLPEAAVRDRRLLERFHNEVRVARQVSHPNVCRVYDIGEADGHPFISMEYVDGEDLASLLGRIGRLPAEKAVEVARKICAGLAAAHARGIIHRDLKPHNIMLDRRGEAVIMDFGLAAVASELQAADIRSGTPTYMSPEQLRGAEVTAKSDIYALGLIFYELFTGRRAYEAKTVAQLLELQEAAQPAGVTSVAGEVDPVIERVIQRCLHPDPAMRPASALAVAATLPGGDPLAAALAAGETPSPELVAASGRTEGISVRWAIPCLIVIGFAVVVQVVLSPRLTTLGLTPAELSPEVLAQKAREAAAALGWPDKPADRAWWMQQDADYLRDAGRRGRGGRSWGAWFEAEPPVHLVYRQSPQMLESLPDGEITVKRPAPILPGMVRVQVDAHGRLREFEAVPPEWDESDAANAETDPTPVFRWAGLDPARFQPAPPRYLPAVAFDRRAAWTGTLAALPEVTLTLEVAWWKQRVTSARVIWPWTRAMRGEERERSTREWAGAVFSLALAGTALFFILLLARRNLRSGRGDRQGAFRLAAFTFALGAVEWLGAVHFIPRPSMVGIVMANVSFGLTSAMGLWLLYIALEPYVRSRWPQAMITWSRVLSGKLSDPRAAADLLYGCVIGGVVISAYQLRSWWGIARGAAPEGFLMRGLSGAVDWAGLLATIVFAAILSGLVIFLLLFGLRTLLRRDYLAAAFAALLLALNRVLPRPDAVLTLDLPLYFVIYGALALALLRLGLLTTTASMIVANLLGAAVVNPWAPAWYNAAGAATLAVVVGMAVYAFARAIGTAAPRPAEWLPGQAPARRSAAGI